ncbi:MAG: sulfide-dependent adenosine diphosphate thiazole synthase [Bacteroidota bacterium]
MEELISNGIVESYFKKLQNHLSLDVAVVGGGPSGLVASYYLAKRGRKVALFERKLAPGGGMWGGAMMFNQIIVQKDALSILDELNISHEHYKEDQYLVDSIEATSALIYHSSQAGTTVFNNFSAEDVIIRDDKVSGIVVNWGPVHREGLHVDPLAITASAVLEGSGHDCEVARIVARKNQVQLNTATGQVMGERSLSVEEAEKTTVENTKEIYPGLFVSGMAANGVSGSFRMGPIFGGMLLSGKKAADLIEKKLSNG